MSRPVIYGDSSAWGSYWAVLENHRRRAAAVAALLYSSNTPPPLTLVASAAGDGQAMQVSASDTIAVGVAENVTLTPKAGQLTVAGSLPLVDALNVTLTKGSGRTTVNRLRAVSFFIPKAISEPFFGDLLESLADMEAEGYSATAIRWAAISQVVMLLLRLVWVLRRR